jgi:hypothetical protein
MTLLFRMCAISTMIFELFTVLKPSNKLQNTDSARRQLGILGREVLRLSFRLKEEQHGTILGMCAFSTFKAFHCF